MPIIVLPAPDDAKEHFKCVNETSITPPLLFTFMMIAASKASTHHVKHDAFFVIALKRLSVNDE